MSVHFLPEAVTPQLSVPAMPAWRYWFAVPVVIALCTLGLLLAFPQYRITLSKGLLACLLAWGGILGIRLLYLGYQQQRYQSERAMIAYHESVWQQWARQSVSVLGQYLLLPQGLNATQLTFDLPANHQQVLTFADEIGLQLINEQVSHLLTTLSPTLAPLIKSYKVTVTVLSPVQDNQLDAVVRQAWQQQFANDTAIAQVVVVDNWSLSDMAKWFDEETTGVQCYLVLADTQERYSQTLAGLVLTPDNHHKQGIPLQQILRPLAFFPKDNKRSLRRLLSVQSPEQIPSTLWLKEKADTALADYIKTHLPPITLQESQYYLGESGPFSDFIGLMLSLINSHQQHHSQGVIARSRKGWLLSQVAPILEDDDED